MHTAFVEVTPAARSWRPWTIWLPCLLALLWLVLTSRLLNGS